MKEIPEDMFPLQSEEGTFSSILWITCLTVSCTCVCQPNNFRTNWRSSRNSV